jgi:hypothetical protein
LTGNTIVPSGGENEDRICGVVARRALEDVQPRRSRVASVEALVQARQGGLTIGAPRQVPSLGVGPVGEYPKKHGRK